LVSLSSTTTSSLVLPPSTKVVYFSSPPRTSLCLNLWEIFKRRTSQPTTTIFVRTATQHTTKKKKKGGGCEIARRIVDRPPPSLSFPFSLLPHEFARTVRLFLHTTNSVHNYRSRIKKNTKKKRDFDMQSGNGLLR
jgi:hypothetical protein